MPNSKQTLSGFGRYPTLETQVAHTEFSSTPALPHNTCVISRGQGRSYGDAAIAPSGTTLLTERANRLLSFNASTEILTVESGCTVSDIIKTFGPRGWFLPVVPGTQHVSIGGCVAADAHGKNHHHQGSFASSVQTFTLLTADGQRHRCSREENANIFWATFGGMGLTGIILEVSLQLRRIETGWIQTRHTAVNNLEQAFVLLSDDNNDDHYTIVWLDGFAKSKKLGQGVFMRGHHAEKPDMPAERPLWPKAKKAFRLPFPLPTGCLNSAVGKITNQLYRWKNTLNTTPFLQTYQDFFFPLDSIVNWPALYGKKGMQQYQCCLPETCAFEGIKQLLQLFQQQGIPIYLATLKRFGEGNEAPLSFPQAGYTLALDVPLSHPKTLDCFAESDDIVLAHKGRVYLAKDARLSKEAFQGMYPRLSEWLTIKKALDPQSYFKSALSERLL